MYTITRKFTFDAGHRIIGHEGKCRHIHGHTYTAEVTIRAISAHGLDNLGRVIDFSVLKEKIGSWIAENWDHNFICRDDDPLVRLGQIMANSGVWKDPLAPFEGRRPYIMVDNPTAENLAYELYKVVTTIMGRYDIRPTNVRMWETPNCFADYSEKE